jgi:hypothetical protein
VAVDVNRLLAGAAPHLMVTDPPYGVEFDSTWRANVLGRRRVPGGVPNDDRADWREAYALFPGDVVYVFHGWRKGDVVIAGLEATGYERRRLIICAKPQFVLSRGHYHSQYEACWYAVRTGRMRIGKEVAISPTCGRLPDLRTDETSGQAMGRKAA